jgi:hypothetical protein
MAIIGLHFSGVYKEKLLSGQKCASVMPEANMYAPGSFAFVYVAEGNVMDKNAKEKRIGEATIKESKICQLKDLTDEEAKNCGYDTPEELIDEMKRWYLYLTNKSVVTYVRFETKISF